jgi:hypothetical protein
MATGLFAALAAVGMASAPFTELHVSNTSTVPNVDADGSLAAPFPSVEAALRYRREISLSQQPLEHPLPHRITLSSGPHLPFKLVPELDNGVQIEGADSGPPSVVTGGIEVPPSLFTANRDTAGNGTVGTWTLKIVSAMGCKSYGCPVVSVHGTSSDKFRVTVRWARCCIKCGRPVVCARWMCHNTAETIVHGTGSSSLLEIS